MATDGNDPDGVWPASLTNWDLVGFHKQVVDGACVVLVIAHFAHFPAFAFPSWGP